MHEQMNLPSASENCGQNLTAIAADQLPLFLATNIRCARNRHHRSWGGRAGQDRQTGQGRLTRNPLSVRGVTTSISPSFPRSACLHVNFTLPYTLLLMGLHFVLVSRSIYIELSTYHIHMNLMMVFQSQTVRQGRPIKFSVATLASSWR